MCSTIDFGEKGYKLLEQILFNFLALFPTLNLLLVTENDHAPKFYLSKIVTVAVSTMYICMTLYGILIA